MGPSLAMARPSSQNAQRASPWRSQLTKPCSVSEMSSCRSCGASQSSPDVTILWTAPADGTFRFDTEGSTYDTALTLRDVDCPAGLECTAEFRCEPPPPECEVGADCGGGFECVAGRCVFVGDCVGDGDCPDGQSCVDFLCVPDRECDAQRIVFLDI